MADQPNTQLAVAEEGYANLSTVPIEDLKAIVKSVAFLPRIQLAGSNSKLVQKNIVKAGEYFLARGEEVIVLGPTFNFFNICYRLKACNLLSDKVMSFFSVSDPEFQKIKEKSDIGGEENMGYVYGPEYLVWLPSSGEYALFHFNNKSARMESNNMTPLCGRRGTAKSHFHEGKRYSWWMMDILPCSVPFTIPPKSEADVIIQPFLNPPKSEIESVSEKEKESRER